MVPKLSSSSKRRRILFLLIRLKVQKLINIRYMYLVNPKRLCLAGLCRNLLLVYIIEFILILSFLTKAGKALIMLHIILINTPNNTKLKF